MWSGLPYRQPFQVKTLAMDHRGLRKSEPTQPEQHRLSSSAVALALPDQCTFIFMKAKTTIFSSCQPSRKREICVVPKVRAL
jgi:hypothetical protein